MLIWPLCKCDNWGTLKGRNLSKLSGSWQSWEWAVLPSSQADALSIWHNFYKRTPEKRIGMIEELVFKFLHPCFPPQWDLYCKECSSGYITIGIIFTYAQLCWNEHTIQPFRTMTVAGKCDFLLSMLFLLAASWVCSAIMWSNILEKSSSKRAWDAHRAQRAHSTSLRTGCIIYFSYCFRFLMQ